MLMEVRVVVPFGGQLLEGDKRKAFKGLIISVSWSGCSVHGMCSVYRVSSSDRFLIWKIFCVLLQIKVDIEIESIRIPSKLYQEKTKGSYYFLISKWIHITYICDLNSDGVRE